MNISLYKNDLRKIARNRRKAFVSGSPGAWTPLSDGFGQYFERGATLASYRATGTEADPSPIEALARQSLMRVSYPRIDADGLMRFYQTSANQMLVTSTLGIEEPGADAERAEPDIILVPLLAFDRSGTRLGQGGGHYDRALAAAAAAMRSRGLRLLKIGVAWSVQEMADLPREPWDIPLDHVITEREWIMTS